MAPNNFNKNIQQKFNSRKIEPSAQSWDRLDAMLTIAEERKQPKSYFWLKIAASFLLFLGIGYVFFQQNYETKIIQPTNEVVITKEKSTINNNIENQNKTKMAEELIVKTSNSATITVTKQNENSKYKSKSETSVSIFETQNKAIAQNENYKENLKPEQINEKPAYNYVTPEILLAEVQGNTKSNGNTNTYKSTLKVNPNDLLNSVESELDQSFKNKTLSKLKQAKSAFVNRNYN